MILKVFYSMTIKLVKLLKLLLNAPIIMTITI